MQHYQIKKACGVCKRAIIADVFSIGTPHQSIEALTHAECAVREMPEGEVEQLGIKSLGF